MALLQSVNLLSVNKAAVDNPTLGFPGTNPTTASPSPVFGLNNASIQGVSVYSGTDFPTAQAKVNISYFNKAERTTVNIYVSQTAAAIIAAS